MKKDQIKKNQQNKRETAEAGKREHKGKNKQQKEA